LFLLSEVTGAINWQGEFNGHFAKLLQAENEKPVEAIVAEILGEVLIFHGPLLQELHQFPW
jgi:hypothetical protein